MSILGRREPADPAAMAQARAVGNWEVETSFSRVLTGSQQHRRTRSLLVVPNLPMATCLASLEQACLKTTAAISEASELESTCGERHELES